MAAITEPPIGAQFELRRGRQRLVVTEVGAGVRSWTVGDNVNLAVGQGDLQASPLQMAVAYSAIENGGRVVRPHLGVAVEDNSTGRELQKKMWNAYSAAIEKHVGSKLSDADAMKLCGLLDRLGCSCSEVKAAAARDGVPAR